MMYRVRRKRIKTKERIMVAGETFHIEELGIEPGPKLDRLIDRLTRLDQITEIETVEDKPAASVSNGKNDFEITNVTNVANVATKTEDSNDPADQLVRKGPWYFLPNGEKVKGKEKALEALATLSG